MIGPRRDEGHVLSKYSGRPNRSFRTHLLMLWRVDIPLKPSASSDTRHDATNSLANFFAATFKGPGQFAFIARFCKCNAPLRDDPRPRPELSLSSRPLNTRQTKHHRGRSAALAVHRRGGRDRQLGPAAPDGVFARARGVCARRETPGRSAAAWAQATWRRGTRAHLVRASRRPRASWRSRGDTRRRGRRRRRPRRRSRCRRRAGAAARPAPPRASPRGSCAPRRPRARR